VRISDLGPLLGYDTDASTGSDCSATPAGEIRLVEGDPMQLFCVGQATPSLDEQRLVDALRTAGRAFPALAGETAWSARSTSGNVVVAAMRHADDVAAPRRYEARGDGVVVAYDGLPVHASGAWPGHDAAELLAHWSELPQILEGQFSALRADLDRDEVSLLTDTLGISPLYHASLNGGHLVSNSVEVLRLIAGLDAPSPLGVSSFVSTGWATGDTTLLDGVEALPGGCEYRMHRSKLVKLPYLSPATVAAHARSGRRISTDEIVTEMVELTAAAAAAGIPIDFGLTAGRDSRLLLALLLAAGADNVCCFTGGAEGSPDVEGARELTRALALQHEVRPLDVLDAVDGSSLAKTFVSQTDGLSSLIQIGDYHDQLRVPSTLAVKMPGLGGELGRCGVRVIPYATNFPPFMVSSRLQEQLVIERARMFDSLWTTDAMNEVKQSVRSFMRERRAEGWRIRELNEAHYAFDRVRRWGSTSVRRTAGTADFFTPFCSRAFMNYCFSLRPEERYVEASHYRMLSALSPTLRDLPFEKAWKPQRPRRVPAQVSYDLAKALLQRSGRMTSSSASKESKPAPPRYWTTWFDTHAADHMDLCLSLPESPLWAWIDRAAVERGFRMGPTERLPIAEGLTRIVTLFWYFHGRHLR
jgi:hypothetical protein